MNDLSAHLRRSGSHDALPFHHECPACVRERLRGTPKATAVVPAPARAGLTAVVLAASGALLNARSTDSARAQTQTAPPPDEAPQTVSPEELEGELADPNERPPEADEQGRADSRAGARRGGTYVVREGDSLWRIARANLGGSPSNARIAGEVQRLWDLNGVKIGTGNPDLIYPGQRLKLR